MGALFVKSTDFKNIFKNVLIYKQLLYLGHKEIQNWSIIYPLKQYKFSAKLNFFAIVASLTSKCIYYDFKKSINPPIKSFIKAKHFPHTLNAAINCSLLIQPLFLTHDFAGYSTSNLPINQ